MVWSDTFEPYFMSDIGVNIKEESVNRTFWKTSSPLSLCSPPFRQAGNVWQGRGSPALGRARNAWLLSTPAKDSLWPRALLLVPPKWTGIPEWPPLNPIPRSSLSILSKASALPFQARPSSSALGVQNPCFNNWNTAKQHAQAASKKTYFQFLCCCDWRTASSA